MERVYEQKYQRSRNSSRTTLALVLIGIGLVCLLGKIDFYPFHYVVEPIVRVFRSIVHLFFSWPFILLLIGVVLLSGRRSVGMVLLILGAIFILPKIFILSGIALFFLFPIALIVIGIILITHLL